MSSANGVNYFPPGYLALTGATEQPKDLPADSVPYVDEHGRLIVDGRGNVIVSSRRTLVAHTKKDSN